MTLLLFPHFTVHQRSWTCVPQSVTRHFVVKAPTVAIPLLPGCSPVFTDSCIELTKVKVKFTLRLAVY
jgi:hypothetical protein